MIEKRIDRIDELLHSNIPLEDVIRHEEKLRKDLYDCISRMPPILPGCINESIKAEKTATEISLEMREAQLRNELKRRRVIFNPFLVERTNLGEPATENILKDIGGINMNGIGFETFDNIDKVVIRTKDGREFEGMVTRSEYMPGRLGREGYSELTVCTLKQTATGNYGIKEVIFNNPATIVKWDDGTQTVVYCQDNSEEVTKIVDGKKVKVRKPKKADTFNPEIGLAMAIVKKHFGNLGNYNNVFHKYIPKVQEERKVEKEAEE